MKISVLVPIFNEELSLNNTLDSILSQTRPADQIVCVNDGSTDNTSNILELYKDKITIVNLKENTGNKSKAQKAGLKFITGDVFVTTDADTVLDRAFLKEVENTFADESVAAMAGYVKSIKNNWLSACRELDYIFAQDLHKKAQSEMNAIFVIPGCAGAFRTNIFKDHISLDHDTITEDLDFTYKLHEQNLKIAYNKKAVAYTQDPVDLPSYFRQMRRWYAGGWQNLVKHIEILGKTNNAIELSLIYVEGLVFTFLFLLLPIISIQVFYIFTLPYVAFSILLGIYGAISRKRVDLFFYSPFFIFVLSINAYIFQEQFVKEVLLRKKLDTWLRADRMRGATV